MNTTRMWRWRNAVAETQRSVDNLGRLSKLTCGKSRQSCTDTHSIEWSHDRMMWHVVFAEPGRFPQSRAAKSRDHAIHVACELLSQSFDVCRIIEPTGRSIERAELDEHYDEGRFPGLRRAEPSHHVAMQ